MPPYATPQQASAVSAQIVRKNKALAAAKSSSSAFTAGTAIHMNSAGLSSVSPAKFKDFPGPGSHPGSLSSNQLAKLQQHPTVTSFFSSNSNVTMTQPQQQPVKGKRFVTTSVTHAGSNQRAGAT